MSISCVEKYYSVQELSRLLSVSQKTVRRRIAAGSFGSHLVDVGTASKPCIRVPGSDVNAYLQRNAAEGGVMTRTQDIFSNLGVSARTANELRRKLEDS